MSSLSFDPVAHIYDATRGYPEDVAQKIANGLNVAAEADKWTRFLEVGVGTGRIALPLASLGRNYTGIDISEKMLAQFEAKLKGDGWREESVPWGTLPDEDAARSTAVRRFRQGNGQGAVRLVVADAAGLPFRDSVFDAVVAVHVFHLIEDWQKAIREALRVLRPGGVLLHCWDEGERSGPRGIRSEWRRIVRELGGSDRQPSVSRRHGVTEWLETQGWQTENLYTVRWKQTVKPRDIFEGITQRAWSSTWFVPDDIFAASIERLRQWVDENYGASIDEPEAQERCFVIGKTRKA